MRRSFTLHRPLFRPNPVASGLALALAIGSGAIAAATASASAIASPWVPLAVSGGPLPPRPPAHALRDPRTLAAKPSRPPDLPAGEIDIDADMADVLHIHLPASQFVSNSLGIETTDSRIGLRYETAFEDPLLAEIAHAVASELRSPTAAGGLLIDSLATCMSARLIQQYTDASSASAPSRLIGEGLDQRRLLRVLDPVEANLEGRITINSMASVACLSRYHFSRAFKKATGQSPHRYVSGRRLERAKTLLSMGDRSLVDIALALNFSSQANFTRAFTKATGQAPGQFRARNGVRSLAAAFFWTQV